MATLLETRYTYWAKSGGANPAYSDQEPDTQGRLTVYYELNAAKTAYNITVNYYVLSFDYQPGSSLGAVSVNCKVNGSSIGTLKSSSLKHTAEGGSKQTHSLGSKTTTVPINADGTCSFSYSCTLTPTYGSTRTFAVTHSLPSVNVSSTITSDAYSGANKEFGSNVNFTISNPSTSVTHTLTYVSGGVTYTIGSGLTTSASYTFPTSLINNYPNNAVVSILVNCACSNGTSSSTWVYLNVPSSYVPSCSLAISDVGNVPSGWGIWLKTISKINGVITASGSAGSTISAYYSEANGNPFYSSTFTTAVLKNSGSQTITTIVTDTRGRQASASKTINVVDYFVPSISSYSVVRCLEDGTEDNEGTYGKVKCKYTIAPINNGTSNLNTKSLVVKYGDETKTFALSSYSGTFEATEYFSDLSIASGHEFEFYIIDYFNPNGIKYSFTMTPSFTTVSKLAGGKGVTLGQIATEEGFHSYMDATFHGAVNIIDDTEGTEFDVSSLVPVVLFEDESGTNETTIPMSETLANYKSVEVTYGVETLRKTVRWPKGGAIPLFISRCGYFDSSYYGVRQNTTSLYFNYANAIKQIGYTFTFKTNNTMVFSDTLNEIYIYKIVGYK